MTTDRLTVEQRAREASITIEGSIYDGFDACVVRDGKTVAHVVTYGDAVAFAASLSPQPDTMPWQCRDCLCREYARVQNEKREPTDDVRCIGCKRVTSLPDTMREDVAFYSDDDVRDCIRVSLEQPDMSLRLFARMKDIQSSHLSEFLDGKRGASDTILIACGFRRRIVREEDADAILSRLTSAPVKDQGEAVAREREACAKVADRIARQCDTDASLLESDFEGGLAAGGAVEAKRIAKTIRALSEPQL